LFFKKNDYLCAAFHDGTLCEGANKIKKMNLLKNKKVRLLLCALIAGTTLTWGNTSTKRYYNNTTKEAGTTLTWGNTSTLTFNGLCRGTGTADDGTVWTVSSDAEEASYSPVKGIHYGTEEKAVSYLTLSTSGISGTVTKVTVFASGATDTKAKLTISVGSTKGSVSLTNESKEYYMGGIAASGPITVSLTQESAKRGLYVQKIIVTYTPTPSKASVSVSSANYATYCFSHNLDFSGTGITVFKAKAMGTYVALTEIADGIVPANTGVILYHNGSAAVDVPVTTTTGSADYSDNELVGIITETSVSKTTTIGDVTYTNYILSNEINGVGFYLATDAGANLYANHAYLRTTTLPSSARNYLAFGDEGDDTTTGLPAVPQLPAAAPNYYNISGQRIATPGKGLIIVRPTDANPQGKSPKKLFIK